MKSWFFSSLLVVVCAACEPPQPAATTPSRPASVPRPAAPKPLPPPRPLPSPDSLTISEPCAVLYRPNLQRIEELKKPNEEDFYVVADDMMFYAYETGEYLQKHHIKTIHTHATVLRFQPASGPAQTVNLRHSRYGWGLLLFDGRHPAKEADLVEPAQDVKAVFKR